jgi:hypothetical protein
MLPPGSHASVQAPSRVRSSDVASVRSHKLCNGLGTYPILGCGKPDKDVSLLLFTALCSADDARESPRARGLLHEPALLSTWLRVSGSC